MESDYDGDIDEKMSNDAEQRYMRLHAILEDISSGSLTRNSEWYADHIQLLYVYDRHFGGYSGVHPEITNPEFREKCELLDTLNLKLMNAYNSYHWFGIYDYSKFNETLIWVADYVFEHKEDELGLLFSNLTV